jgi:transcription-repair coupling factor (superfamily II helicase)
MEDRERAGGGDAILIEGISPASFPLIAASIFNDSQRQTVVVAESYQKMHEAHLDLSAMVDDNLLFMFPPWETLPYEYVSPTEKTERERITALYRLIKGEPVLVVTTVESLIRKIPEKAFFEKKGVTLKTHEDHPFNDIVEMLAAYGYSREKRVETYGHFAVKGGIIDIFPPSHDAPLRLDFFGDTLESIREFDLNSQISSREHASVTIYPRKELILFKPEREKLFRIMKDAHDRGLELPDSIRSQIKEGRLSEVSGIEDLFPLVIPGDSLLSYLRDDARIVLMEPADLAARKNSLEKTFHELFKKKHASTLCLAPEEIMDSSLLDAARGRSISLQTFTASQHSLKWQLKSIPNFHGRIKQVREEITGRIERGWKTIVTTGFEGQARRLFDLLSEFNPDSKFEEFSDTHLNILLSPLKEGIEITSSKLLIITDHEIFGKSYRKKREFKSKTSRPIDSFLDLKSGDYVVHINHGIGVFGKIERMAAGGVERDFLLIEYADGDKLYVSLDQITMVQKYIGIEGRKPRIDHLGRRSAWNRIKERVKKSVEEVAAELIKIYSTRRAMKGFQFPPDTLWK